jgi:hypothetical protein
MAFPKTVARLFSKWNEQGSERFMAAPIVV